METIINKTKKIKAGGPKPWITCVRSGNNSCAHPTTYSKNNKFYYS
tara:strand:- start:501 stop:638 length:138 start_codon:yes stop_codon:yes gene_type:complete